MTNKNCYIYCSSLHIYTAYMHLPMNQRCLQQGNGLKTEGSTLP